MTKKKKPFKLPEAFNLAEERDVECPFLEGWVFTIRPVTFSPYRDAVTEDPGEVLEMGIKAEVAANLEANLKRLTGEAREQFVDRKRSSILEAKLEKIEIGDLGKKINRDAVALLVKGVPAGPINEDDQLVELTSSQIRGLFDLEDPLPEAYADDGLGDDVVEISQPARPALSFGSGTPLGMALGFWVLFEANKRAAFRAEFLERAAKNSPTPSRGSKKTAGA